MEQKARPERSATALVCMSMMQPEAPGNSHAGHKSGYSDRETVTDGGSHVSLAKGKSTNVKAYITYAAPFIFHVSRFGLAVRR